MQPATQAVPFPSLTIRADALVAQGWFAELQAEYLQPDAATVSELASLLEAANAGIVAHFYMDAELQGVLSACPWPHIQISDSLVMADRAIAMAEKGIRTILVLGVDFMSENVRAMLDAAGHEDVAVYRLAADPIGCSLAESAQAPAYEAWLREAAKTPNSLHVVYINTSLLTKAQAHSIVPTITCTSSNVVRTVLQAFAQVPDLHVWYGPDTYMGANLANMFERYAELDDDAIRALHPAHDQASIRSLTERFHYYEQGTCIVHHMFGERVVAQVRSQHAAAFHTAHLEVPGEMFALASEAAALGRGVVGSTSNILNFIRSKVAEATASSDAAHLPFVLGTEAGMVTSIVRSVQESLKDSRRDDVDVEIIFPVAAEAMSAAPDSELGVVPGAAGGEGCSTAGGCATCPYMKMNSLDALLGVLGDVGQTSDLEGLEPRKYAERIGGRTAADLGGEPILHMRDFQRSGALPEALVNAIQAADAL